MINEVVYNSFDIRYKNPFGAVTTDREVLFSVSAPKNGLISDICLHIYTADTPLIETIIPLSLASCDMCSNWYSCKFTSAIPELFFYYFSYTLDDIPLTLTKSEEEPHWQLTIYDSAMKSPSCLSGVMYQVFPDRFKNSGKPKTNVPNDRYIHENWLDIPHYLPNEHGEITNTDYFGGDLLGIAEQLPYLNSLGVSTLYLNPIFEAHSNHRYNTANYMKIDPILGDENDFIKLCADAKKLGISVILDGVFSHTGDDSIYFNKHKRYGDAGAFHDVNSPYRSWYKWNDDGSYISWWGFETLPEVDEYNQAYHDFICGENGVLQKWLRLGASGYRLDVADELPDSFLQDIQKSVKSYSKDAVIIGEVWEDASNKISYGIRRKYLLGSQLDTVMNYPFKDAILQYVRHGDSEYFITTVLNILNNYPRPVINILMNSLSTHDTERAITRLVGEEIFGDRQWQRDNHFLSLDDYEHGKKLLKLASLIQYTISGIPCIYYGDEVGVSSYKDPFNRTCYPYGHEDLELLEHFRILGKLRTDYPVLQTGDFTPICYNENILMYTRGDNLLIAINRDNKPHSITLPDRFCEYNECCERILGQPLDNSMLQPYSAVVYSMI